MPMWKFEFANLECGCITTAHGLAPGDTFFCRKHERYEQVLTVKKQNWTPANLEEAQ